MQNDKGLLNVTEFDDDFGGGFPVLTFCISMGNSF